VAERLYLTNLSSNQGHYEGWWEPGETFHVIASTRWTATAIAEIMPDELTLTIQDGRLVLSIDGEHPKGGRMYQEIYFDIDSGTTLGEKFFAKRP
jgi:hypothetical protein